MGSNTAEWAISLQNIRGIVELQGGTTLVLLPTVNFKKATDLRISTADQQLLQVPFLLCFIKKKKKKNRVRANKDIEIGENGNEKGR